MIRDPVAQKIAQNAVRAARSEGRRPPRWWEVWRPPWPADLVEEFWRQEREEG